MNYSDLAEVFTILSKYERHQYMASGCDDGCIYAKVSNMSEISKEDMERLKALGAQEAGIGFNIYP